MSMDQKYIPLHIAVPLDIQTDFTKKNKNKESCSGRLYNERRERAGRSGLNRKNQRSAGWR
jgi:hypothetical protein